MRPEESIAVFNRDLGNLQTELNELGSAASLVMARALNRAVTAGRTAMQRAIAQDTGLGSRFVKGELRVEKASRADPVAALEVAGRRIPLIEFKARGPEPSRGRGGGVTAKIPGGAGRYPHAFIATVGRGGHRGVFQRRAGAGRKPIYELRGPSLPHVFEKHLLLFSQVTDESLRTNLEHELDFARGRAQTNQE